MEYEAVQDRLNPYDWRVEAIDEQAEGQVYVAIFTGPKAKERAKEYAAWKAESAQ